LSGAGYAVYSVSVLFLAYGITGNLLVAGVVLFIEYGVYTLTFLIAPFVDRTRDKRTILLFCFPVQAVASAFLAFELSRGTLTVPLLLGAVFLLALLWDFAWTVYMVAPRIVVEKRLLFAADGFSSAIGVGTQVGGYAGGGALVYFVGPEGGATAYALLLVAAALASIPLSLRVESVSVSGFAESFREGWAAFRGRAGRFLRQFAAVETLYGFFAALPPLFLTAVAYERFNDPSAAYGLLVTVYAVGGSVAGVVVGHYNPRRSVGVLLVTMPLAAGLLTLLLIPAAVPAIIVATLFATLGAVFSARYDAKYTWVRGTFPPETLGRVTSNIYLFTGVSQTAGALVIAALSPTVGLPTLLLLGGGGLIVAGLAAFSVPFIRRLSF
jgi:predicted MFS family arabinose efflux permease